MTLRKKKDAAQHRHLLMQPDYCGLLGRQRQKNIEEYIPSLG